MDKIHDGYESGCKNGGNRDVGVAMTVTDEMMG